MIKLSTFTFTFFLLFILSACATMPTPAGKWTASMDSPQGPFKIGFDFKVDGGDLSGTVSNDFMGPTPISDGVVKGKDLSFKVNVEGGPAGPMTLNYKGMLEKDLIKFNMDFAGNPPPGAPANVEFTADRVLE